MKCRYDNNKECDEKSFHFCEDCLKDMNRHITEYHKEFGIAKKRILEE